MTGLARAGFCLALLSWLPALAGSQASFLWLPALAGSQTPALASARTWLERRAEIEEYMRTGPILNSEDIPVGVTKPKKVQLAPGGPVEYFAWKVIPPGRRNGFWESYKSEIAAYELDKLIGLDMKPPTVERRIRGDLGAAIMWCEPTKSFTELGGVPKPPPQHLASWNRQIMRAKMFDNLIHNKDPNLGNWLIDPAWNVILIDHSRAFTGDRGMIHDLSRVDGELWDRMKALTEENLTAALRPWVLGGGEIRAILQRRDRMQAKIDDLIAARGEAAVIMR